MSSHSDPDRERHAREAVTHDLKVWPEFFAALWDNTKSFEWRRDDRDYQVGDVLILREFSTETGYTGRCTKRTIGYVLRGRFDMPAGFATLGFLPLPVDAEAIRATREAEIRERVDNMRRPHMSWCQIGKPETSPLASWSVARCDCGASTYNHALDNVLGVRCIQYPYHDYPATALAAPPETPNG